MIHFAIFNISFIVAQKIIANRVSTGKIVVEQAMNNENAMASKSQPPKLNAKEEEVYYQYKTLYETVDLQHFHNHNTNALQRTGYLWKTGPKMKSFKSRWCVLYRHSSLSAADANMSYYSSSSSSSLCGRIMLNDIEFVGCTETIPTKTRLPKLNPSEKPSDSSQQANGFSFFKIGIRSKQGRIYLFAARSEDNLQLWMHSFTKALCLHSIENKGKWLSQQRKFRELLIV